MNKIKLYSCKMNYFIDINNELHRVNIEFAKGDTGSTLNNKIKLMKVYKKNIKVYEYDFIKHFTKSLEGRDSYTLKFKEWIGLVHFESFLNYYMKD